MHAIPTKYKGIQFRSRLEARWACFFDLCGLRWDYEPCDFDGWIPDFLIRDKVLNIFAEVKPITDPSEIQWENAWYNCGCKTGNARFLLLGLAPVFPYHHENRVQLGWATYLWGGALEKNKPFFVARDILDSSHQIISCLDAAWTEAQNATQWRPPRG